MWVSPPRPQAPNYSNRMHSVFCLPARRDDVVGSSPAGDRTGKDRSGRIRGRVPAQCRGPSPKQAARIALPSSVRLKPVSTSTMTGNRGGGHRNAGDLRLGLWPADDVVGDQQNTGIGRGEAEGTDVDARPEFPAHHIGIDFGAPARKVRRTTPKPARNFTQGARGRPTRLPATAPREQADLPP